jgi:hypothetical protein
LVSIGLTQGNLLPYLEEGLKEFQRLILHHPEPWGGNRGRAWDDRGEAELLEEFLSESIGDGPIGVQEKRLHDVVPQKVTIRT